jgi:O-methyltransferase involved in polyketide biosynthesis
MSEADDRDSAAPIDVRAPSTARIYDYLLGGKDHFPADRVAAEQLKAASPDLVEHVHANRRFVQRAVRLLAGKGVRQFVDLGSGIPTSPDVHEIVCSVRPEAHVLYVDNDPVVAAHSRAWRATRKGIRCIEADVRDPGTVLAREELASVIDPGEPVAVLMTALLHFTENADEIVQAFREWMPPGSFLVITIITSEGLAERQRAPFNYAYQSSAPLVWRTREEIEALFSGLDMLEPGLVETDMWRNPEGRSFREKTLAGIGRKP